MRALRLLAAALILAAAPASADEPRILGEVPAYATRTLTTDVPNAGAIVWRAWMPGLEEGYVPQGVAFAEGTPIIAAYKSTGGGSGPCRLFRIDPETGAVTGTYDLPPRCGHAGGLAYAGNGRLFVADTWLLIEVDLAKAFDPGAGTDAVVRQVSINFPMRGSFLAYHEGALWIGEYKKPGEGTIYKVPLSAVEKPAEPRGLTEQDAVGRLTVAAASQGAAFDDEGQLWLTQSSSQFGRIQKVSARSGQVIAEYRTVAGIEDIAFDEEGTLWTVSEAGSRRWFNWPTFYPLVLRIDPARLQ